MTIRSIDLQVLVQKTAEVSKIQQAMQSQANSKQQENLQQITDFNKNVSQTVTKNRETEHKRVRDEEEKERKRKNKSENKKDEDDNQGIDIIV
ncbi:MAG: hypothetical protein GX333_06200 [Syntrophomonadaceae bacterium]|nr:hypothetical protein [Syntrophomonadaceae bacterium]